MKLQLISQSIVLLIALIHLYVLILEMFLWTRPYGLKFFNQKEDVAKSSATLAANQGLYNGFLSMGLISSFFFKNPDIAFAFQLFFLGCVLLAGIYGAMTTGPKVGPRIFYIQALPALLGILALITF
jgi:putative membrane protein